LSNALHIDYETRSRVELKKAGLFRYAEDESTAIHCMGYVFGSQEPKMWVPRASLPYAVVDGFKKRRPNVELIVQPRPPREVASHIVHGGEVRAHNAMFERKNTEGHAGAAIGMPRILASQTVCTMAKASAHGLPAALGQLAQALGTHPKNETGANDMRYLAKPRKDGTFAEPEDDPERYVRLYDYCIDDVLAERAADLIIPDLSADEQRVYVELDQAMNDRGIRADRKAIENLIALVNEHKANIAAEVQKTTGVRPGQTAVLADWCRAHGYPSLPNLQADTVKKACLDPACPDLVKRVLRMYSTYNMKAVTKYPAMLNAMCKDGRLRGMFLYHAADTGRWSSKIVQLHNLYRPKIEDPELAISIAENRSLDDIKFYFDVEPMRVFGSCVRSVLTADPGKVLVFPDFAGIEARVNAWFWGEDWKLQAFRDYDTIIGWDPVKKEPIRKGPDLYKVAYAKSFGITPDKVDKAGRQVGKVQELALGYQGGVGAFVTMAEQAGIDLNKMAADAWDGLPKDVKAEAADFYEWARGRGLTHDLPIRTFIALESFKRLWRRAHPRIVKGWEQLEDAARGAIANPGKVFSCAGGKLSFRVWRQWLCMRLPSGRVLWYFRPELDKKDGKTIRFWGTDTYTRRWCLTSTYGGKLDENAVQAFSRDLLVFAKFGLQEYGYDIVGSVHDEPIAETLESFGSFEEARKIMTRVPTWAKGLPLAIDGHRQFRYRK
jgi:DNA polymerase